MINTVMVVGVNRVMVSIVAVVAVVVVAVFVVWLMFGCVCGCGYIL